MILGAGLQYLTLNDFPDVPEVEEDRPSFAGNATKKAVELARWLARPANARTRLGQAREAYVLADDSGLEVDALNGAPGVLSARFAALDSRAARNAPDNENNAKLLRLLRNVPKEKRTARFRCILALTPVCPAVAESSSPVCYADEPELGTRLFEGVCEGKIGFEPRGKNGFGYDPLFIPDGRQETFAELGEDVKNRLSHRARALLALKAALEASDFAG
jgi:XTP/dITP diphosphohydrolase